MANPIEFEINEKVVSPAQSNAPNEIYSVNRNERILEISFEERVRNFVMKQGRQLKLFILSPCYGNMCHVNYMVSLISSLDTLKNYGIHTRVEFCRNDSLISRARNNLIARAMADPNCTHMLFIDSDITWTPTDILKLIIADKPLCGGIYPIKHYNWNRLVDGDKNVVKEWIDNKNKSRMTQHISDQEIIQHRLLRYNMNTFAGHLTIEQNLIRVKHLATGFMMIRRDVIENMMKAFPSTKYKDDVGFLKNGEEEFSYALFDCAVEDGHYLSEDWLFCSRWTKMGGEIHADATINLTHSGVEDYNGCLMTTLL
jgi:hypothetical protein